VHALDTARSTARCIDVTGLDPSILSRLRLRMSDGGRSVRIADGVQTLAVVDTRTLAVKAPSGRSWRLPVALAAAGALALAALVHVLLARRRPAPALAVVD
jgi:hypothetical protein